MITVTPIGQRTPVIEQHGVTAQHARHDVDIFYDWLDTEVYLLM